MKTQRYLAGIIGCGNIGSEFDGMPGKKPIYTHAGAYYYHPKFQLVAAVDIDRSKLRNFSKKWNVKNVYTEFEEIFNTENLDILSICTPKETHYEIIKKTVAKGIKMILCEKPFTGDLVKAKELVKMCEDNDVLLAINYTRRYAKGHQKVKEILSTGAIGRIQVVNCLCTKGIINNGSHVIDLLTYFFGEIDWAASFSTINNYETGRDYDLNIKLHFSADFCASIIFGDARYYSIFEMDILGAAGRLRITQSGYEIRVYHIKDSFIFKGYRELDRTGSYIRSGMDNSMVNALDNLVMTYEKKSTLLCSGQDSLNTIKIIDLAIKSAIDNGTKKYNN